jgi:hypothetical protein
MLPIGLQHKWYSGGRQKVLSAIVRDANRQALAYVYFEEEPGRRSANNIFLIRRHVFMQCRHFSILLGQHDGDDALGDQRV